jgi:hypothetical protein
MVDTVVGIYDIPADKELRSRLRLEASDNSEFSMYDARPASDQSVLRPNRSFEVRPENVMTL